MRPSHRVTGNRKDSVNGAGWDTFFGAIDDHARIAFTAMHPDEQTPLAVRFLRDGVAYYAGLGVRIKRLLTDNGSALRSREFAHACQALGIVHELTRAYRPQPIGRAEHSSSQLCANGPTDGTYRNSERRTNALASWQHHYNWHRQLASHVQAQLVKKQPLDSPHSVNLVKPFALSNVWMACRRRVKKVRKIVCLTTAKDRSWPFNALKRRNWHDLKLRKSFLLGSEFCRFPVV